MAHPVDKVYTHFTEEKKGDTLRFDLDILNISFLTLTYLIEPLPIFKKLNSDSLSFLLNFTNSITTVGAFNFFLGFLTV